MNITWYGHSCFKLQGKDVTLVTDPFDKETGLKPPAGAADIVTISHESGSHSNRETTRGEAFIIDGPGEYEKKKVVIRGIESDFNQEESNIVGGNTICIIIMEDLRICHLGDLNQKSLTTEQLKSIGEVDILFVPVGGISTIDSKAADGIIAQIEPRVIVPMHYKIAGVKGELAKLEDIKAFSANHNLDPQAAVSKISIKKKDLPEEGSQYIIMDLGK